MVKLAIWCTRKNKVEGSGCTDPVLLTKCFVKKRLIVEYAFYSLTQCSVFFFICGVVIIFCVNLMGMEVLL